VVVTPAGSDGRRAIAATLRLPGGRRVSDEQRPIRFKVPPRRLKRGRSTKLSADVITLDGRVKDTAARVPRPC
jgi:hypothetical protein